MSKNILIVEDDPAISKLLYTNLTVAGYQACCALDGQAALSAIQAQSFDLALLDIMLPGLDGFELLPFMQQKQIPVIFVSAKADVQSRVQGLRLGAEDYLVKPFDILELLVRMEKVLSRYQPMPDSLSFLDVTLHTASHTATQNGQLISLKPIEYELLRTLMTHPGMVFTREDLLRQVWGDAYIGETRTVDVHIAALRKKLNWNQQIATVYKLGYRLEDKK